MVPIVGCRPTISGAMVLVRASLAAVIMGRVMREGVRVRQALEATI